MKKRVIGLCMAAILTVSGSTVVTAEPETLNGKDASISHKVTGTYTALPEAKPVYKVDVSWGSMEFTYEDGNTIKTWNPVSHTYTDVVEAGSWTNDIDANKITVTNCSNKAVTASIAVQMNEGSEITASLGKEQMELADASIGATTEIGGTASTDSTDISLSGALTDKSANKTTIGSVTVTFADIVQP